MDVRGLSLTERLAAQVVVDEHGCWLWTGANGGKVSGNSGYGTLTINGKSVSSHRAAWIIHDGAIPDGLCVLRKCDVRRCCNPDHLYLGDKKQNRKDFMLRHPDAAAIVRKGQIAGAVGVKRFWSEMTEERRKEFCAKRAAAQAAKRKGKE